MKKTNCWEFKKCGREMHGNQNAELGVCPAAIEIRTDGINAGVNGGRCCWAVTGTMCCGNVEENFASKLANCMECDFFQKIKREENSNFVPSMDIFKRIKANSQ